MKKLLFILIAFLSIIFVSCQKDSPASLVGKWKVKSGFEKENNVTTSSYVGQAADYVDFKSNGFVEEYIDGSLDEMPYTINGNTVTIDGENWTIQNLTKSSVTLNYLEISGTDRFEMILNLER